MLVFASNAIRRITNFLIVEYGIRHNLLAMKRFNFFDRPNFSSTGWLFSIFGIFFVFSYCEFKKIKHTMWTNVEWKFVLFIGVKWEHFRGEVSSFSLKRNQEEVPGVQVLFFHRILSVIKFNLDRCSLLFPNVNLTIFKIAIIQLTFLIRMLLWLK